MQGFTNLKDAEHIAVMYSNAQIGQAAQLGIIPQELAVMAGMFQQRMAQNALAQQAPTTTVAQDMLTPMQPPQMPQGMPQEMPQGAPQQMPQAPQGPEDVGIGALDAGAATQMAGGGIVAFEEGGEVPGYFSGGRLFPEDSLIGQVQRGTGFQFPEGSLFGDFQQKSKNDPDYIEAIKKEKEAAEAAKAAKAVSATPVAPAAPAAASAVGTAADKERRQNEMLNMTDPDAKKAAAQALVRDYPEIGGASSPQNAPTNAKPDGKPKPGLGGAAQNMGLGNVDTQSLLEDIKKAQKESNMTPEQIAAAKKTGGEDFDKAMPDRFGFIEKSIKSQTKDIEKQRSDNSNEALIYLGLNLMGTKSQYFLQAAGEAGLSAMQAFKQGQKDIKDSEANLLKSQTAFAQAQSLRDEGKNSAAERAADRAQALKDKALAQRQTIFANGVQLANLRNDEIKTQAIANYYNANAANKGKTISEQYNDMMDSAFKIKDPALRKKFIADQSELIGISGPSARPNGGVEEVNGVKTFVP